ncbi:Uncharacterised protein [Serratia fonticola]|nr:Uncharacterised protein [Serratia fonticola]
MLSFLFVFYAILLRDITGILLGSFCREEIPHESISHRGVLSVKRDYMCLTIASPNSEHFSSLAPSIRRSKS